MRYFPLLLLLSMPLWAQGRRPEPSEKPYLTVAAEAFHVRSFEDDKGGFYLLWSVTQGTATVVRGQHINDQNQTLWTDGGKTMVQSVGKHWDANPDAKGGLLLAWDQPNGMVMAKRLGADGEPVWSSKDGRLSVSSFTHSQPMIVPDGAGGAYVVWEEDRLAPRWVLMAQHMNGFGVPMWTTEGLRVSRRPSGQRLPRAVYDGAAGVIVTWQDFRENASQIQAQRLNYQGTRLWGEEGIVVTAPAGDPKKPPFLGEVGGGSAVFAWQASSAGADRIFLQLGTATGKFGWPLPGIELTAGTWHEWNPVLHGDGQGGVWVGWEDFRNNQNWVVYVKHVLVSGLSGWPANEATLTSIQADQGRLSLTDDSQKGILAAWVDNRHGNVGIYLQEINDQGVALLGNEGQTIVTHLVNPQAPKLLSLSPQKAVIAWADTPSKGQWSLFWKVITPSPVPPK